MDSFETHTWADFVVETTFLGTPTILMPFIINKKLAPNWFIIQAPLHMILGVAYPGIEQVCLEKHSMTKG
jgi:hypothetical protein